MKKLEVNPRVVYPFHPQGVGKDILEYVRTNGWKLPRVPVFEIPQEIRHEGYEYVLADGNWRRELACYLEVNLPVALYQKDEKIDVVKDRLANFRHSTDPKLYRNLIWMFTNRRSLL